MVSNPKIVDYKLKERCLTVEQLIEELQALPEHAKKAYVVFGCDYGDHCHTTQALPVETVRTLDYGTETVMESAYSHSGLKLETEHIPEEEDEFTQLPIVVLE